MLNVNAVSKTRIKETPAKNKSHYHDSSKKKNLRNGRWQHKCMKMMIFKISSCLMSTSYYSDSFSTLQPNISFFIDIDSLSYYSFLNFKEITQFPSGPITFIELNWIELKDLKRSRKIVV